MPLTIDPIACSRMPNAMLRPDQRSEKRPPPTNSVLVDSTRSAAPPIIVGTASLNACITFLPASRVAMSSPTANSGTSQAPIRPSHAASHSSRACGNASPHVANRRCPPGPAPPPPPRPPPPAPRGNRPPPRRKPPLPLGLELVAALDTVHVRGDLVRDEELLVGIPPERLLRRGDLLRPER